MTAQVIERQGGPSITAGHGPSANRRGERVEPSEHGGEQAYYVCAIARSRPERVPAPLPAEGIVPEAPVYALTHRDLLAVVSHVPLAEFSAEALEEKLQDADWTRERVLAHQRVLAALLDSYTLIPFKFCTLFSSEERVRDMLDRHYGMLDDVLSRLEGTIEWGVKLYCDRRLLVAWVQENSEALRPQREKIARVSEGAAYFLSKKLERTAEEEVERVMGAAVRESHQRLADRAREAVANPVQPPQIHGRRAEMVLNGAYLVDETELDSFRSVLATLEQTYESQSFRYELTGPWPPYNFAALELEE